MNPHLFPTICSSKLRTQTLKFVPSKLPFHPLSKISLLTPLQNWGNKNQQYPVQFGEWIHRRGRGWANKKCSCSSKNHFKPTPRQVPRSLMPKKGVRTKSSLPQIKMFFGRLFSFVTLLEGASLNGRVFWFGLEGVFCLWRRFLV